MKIFKRQKEFDWLNQVSQWSTLVGISGLKGVGKTCFVKAWVLDQDKKSRLISFQRFAQLPKILGTPELNFEASLDHFSQQWSTEEIVVWEDLHFLAPEHLSTLVLFLKNQLSSPLHILVSDESLDEFRMEIPLLSFATLSEDEIQKYVVDFLGVKKDFSAKNVLKETGGFPFFVNIWAQSSEQLKQVQLKLFSSLNEEEKNALVFLYLSPHGIRKDQLPFSVSILQSLEKKLYVTQDSNTFRISDSLSDLVISATEPQTLSKQAGLVFKYSKEKNLLEPFLLWVLALQSQDKYIINDSVLKFEPQRLEGLPEKDLKYLEKYLDALKLFDPIDLSSAANIRMIRLHLQLLILCGKRSQALQIGENLIDRILDSDLNEKELQWLIYDIIHWSHRSGIFKPVEKLLESTIHLSKGELHFLFRLELAFPFIEKDPKRALQTLNRLIQDAASNSLLLAHCYFQKARCHFFLNEYPEALNAYSQSEKSYMDQGKIYFALVARLNQLWILIETRELQTFTKIKSELEEQALRYGYKYILTGALLAESIVDRLQMRYNGSLEKIQKALSLLPANTPPKAKQDILKEKALTLSKLGLFQDAQKALDEIEDAALRRQTELEALLLNQSIEELSESWSQSKNKELYWIYLLQRGEKPDFIQESLLKKTKLGHWALLEYDLIIALREKNEDLIWSVIVQMESLLPQAAECAQENLAISCLKLSLAEAKDQSSYLEKVRLELKLWGCDHIAQLPFLAWIESVSGNIPVQKNKIWMQTRTPDRERWQGWQLNNLSASLKEYTLITVDGSKELSEIPDDLSKFQIVLIEHLGQVIYKRKEIKEFHRKSILRQILAMLLEVYPQGLSKANLASVIWGESYSPLTHDARIYTSIQRLRQWIDNSAIESWESGYRWNAKFSFAYIKSNQIKTLGQHKVQTLILQTLQNFKKSGKNWASRSELLEATSSSESTLKRELSKLLNQGLIQRKGQGPSVVYSTR